VIAVQRPAEESAKQNPKDDDSADEAMQALIEVKEPAEAGAKRKPEEIIDSPHKKTKVATPEDVTSTMSALFQSIQANTSRQAFAAGTQVALLFSEQAKQVMEISVADCIRAIMACTEAAMTPQRENVQALVTGYKAAMDYPMPQ